MISVFFRLRIFALFGLWVGLICPLQSQQRVAVPASAYVPVPNVKLTHPEWVKNATI